MEGRFEERAVAHDLLLGKRITVAQRLQKELYSHSASLVAIG